MNSLVVDVRKKSFAGCSRAVAGADSRVLRCSHVWRLAAFQAAGSSDPGSVLRKFLVPGAIVEMSKPFGSAGRAQYFPGWRNGQWFSKLRCTTLGHRHARVGCPAAGGPRDAAMRLSIKDRFRHAPWPAARRCNARAQVELVRNSAMVFAVSRAVMPDRVMGLA
jgi:hypothetical protein